LIPDNIRQTFEHLRGLSQDWDGTGEAPVPNEESLQRAEAFLKRAVANGLEPSKILPCGDGGVTLLFRAGARLSVVDCYNSGASVLGLSSPKVETLIEEFDFTSEADLSLCVARIHEFLEG
jgi:hypothetical protein